MTIYLISTRLRISLMLGTYVVVLITTPSREEAERIARDLLNKKLAACVNMVSDVKSLFWWEEKKQTSWSSARIRSHNGL